MIAFGAQSLLRSLRKFAPRALRLLMSLPNSSGGQFVMCARKGAIPEGVDRATTVFCCSAVLSHCHAAQCESTFKFSAIATPAQLIAFSTPTVDHFCTHSSQTSAISHPFYSSFLHTLTSLSHSSALATFQFPTSALLTSLPPVGFAGSNHFHACRPENSRKLRDV